MLLMMAEVLRLGYWAKQFPDNALLQWLAFHQSHVAWEGASLHDMIQPSFSFLVGTALAYSLAKRLAAGDSRGQILRHAAWRSLVLVVLGIFLRSEGKPMTNFTFEDTLTQIGLGYFFLVLLAFWSDRGLWMALGVLLGAYWLAWAIYPVPGDSFAAHWGKEANLGMAFDRWFLNLFPRPEPFVANRGGYGTLSFLPTLGTMLLGLLAGRSVKANKPVAALGKTGAALLAVGLLLHITGLCPVVKRIWTPAWTLASGGACFFLLAAFRLWLDGKSESRLAFPLLVVGANSIAAYLIAHWWDGFFIAAWRTNFGWVPGAEMLAGPVALTLMWLSLYWMYERKLFLKI